jgi:hypothetical protein
MISVRVRLVHVERQSIDEQSARATSCRQTMLDRVDTDPAKTCAMKTINVSFLLEGICTEEDNNRDERQETRTNE